MEHGYVDSPRQHTPTPAAELLCVDRRSAYDLVAHAARSVMAPAGTAGLVAGIALRTLSYYFPFTCYALTAVGTLGLLRCAADAAVLPASWIRQSLNNDWPDDCQEFEAQVDGFDVRALYRLREGSDRWVMYVPCNGETLEHMDKYHEAVRLSSFLNANLLNMSYPGVNRPGYAHRRTIQRTAELMLNLLETRKESGGFGASEIVLLGNSLGGGVIGDLCEDRNFVSDIRYAVVKIKTFADFSRAAGGILGRITAPLESLTHLFRMNFNSMTSALQLEEKGILEIIIQEGDDEMITSADQVKDEEVIGEDAALATHLLSLKTDWKHKHFIGDSSGHTSLNNGSILKISDALDEYFAK